MRLEPEPPHRNCRWLPAGVEPGQPPGPYPNPSETTMTDLHQAPATRTATARINTAHIRTAATGTTATHTGTFQGVPWSTVLPIAVVLVYADGFWMTSLQGAVG